MSRNCLVIVSKDEGFNPFSIAETAFDSGVVDKVIISDGSNPQEFRALKKKENSRTQVIRGGHGETAGKGGGVTDGSKAALEQGFDRIAFMDGDLLTVNPKWFPLLFNGLDEAELVKASFFRNVRDAQITRHIIRPLIGIHFPEIWRLDQPLGGELSVTAETLEKILSEGLHPPQGWGIDAFITTQTCGLGKTMGEVCLGEKIHKKKNLAELEPMFYECFTQMIRMIDRHRDRKISQEELLFKFPSPFKKECKTEEEYMNLEGEYENSRRIFSSHHTLNIPHDELFRKAMGSPDYDTFFESTREITAEVWVEALHGIAQSFEKKLIQQYFLRWKVRALAFCFHETTTPEEAEKNTVRQARRAKEYGEKIRGVRAA